MSKRTLFVTAVLLIVSSAAFGFGYGGGTQTQSTYVGISQNSYAWGSGASFSHGASGNAYANQRMSTWGGQMSQTANPSIQGYGFGMTGWGGVVESSWYGVATAFQRQSLPQRGFGGHWPASMQAGR